MKWAEFLSKLSDRVGLVGPLLDAPRPIVMPTVFIDGGADFIKESLAFPVVSVGDGDSAFGKLDHLLPQRKDYSDLGFVLRSLPASVRLVEMLGFLGERRDHELANLGEVHNFLASRRSAVVNLHQGSRIPLVGFTGKMEMEINGIFSLMSFGVGGVRISGDCEYKFDGSLDVFSSHGLSNVGSGRVTFSALSPHFLFLN